MGSHLQLYINSFDESRLFGFTTKLEHMVSMTHHYHTAHALKIGRTTASRSSTNGSNNDGRREAKGEDGVAFVYFFGTCIRDA